MDLEQHPFDLSCLHGSRADLAMRRRIGRRLETDLPSAVMCRLVVGDDTRLRQVLVNLLTNAVKFTERGEVNHACTPNRSPLPGRQGMGAFPQKARARCSCNLRCRTRNRYPLRIASRLFASFSQVDTSTTRRYGGTGWSSASRRLVEMMGGTIWLESDGIPATGTTFHVRLYVACASVRSTGRQHGEACDRQPLPSSGCWSSTTNDEPADPAAATAPVGSRRRGSSAAEALATMAAQPSFDVILLDLQMPDVDGIGLAGRFSAAGRRPLRMILLTSQ